MASQYFLLGVQEAFGLENEEVFKAATCFAGGIGLKVQFVEHLPRHQERIFRKSYNPWDPKQYEQV